MFDIAVHDTRPRVPPHDPARIPTARHTAAQAAAPVAGAWFALALDEIDYPALLVDDEGRLLHLNRSASSELDEHHPLQRVGSALRARRAVDGAPLHEAIAAASHRGLRRLLVLGDSERRVHASVVPLGTGSCGALILLGRRQSCEALSVHGFARLHGLTPAEERVLDALCRGLQPTEICEHHGVGMATVRTQIGSIRQKTGASSLRALTDMVARLPPMIGILGRGAAAGAATIAAWPHTATRLN